VTAVDSGSDALVVDEESGVVMLGWPERQADRERLAARGVPRLLVVSTTGAPPKCLDALEDWVRLPVNHLDLRARLDALGSRHRAHTPPTVDAYGVLRFGDALVLLSPQEQRLAELLLEHFGEVVPNATIEQRIRHENEPSRVAVRVYASRLRKRMAPFGFTITCVANVGYLVHRDLHYLRRASAE